MRYAFNFPIFDQLSDERVLADLAAQAEESGWDAVLLWDHVNLRQPPMAKGGPHAEPWVALALMAERTEKILLGTCVTPIARRRRTGSGRQRAGGGRGSPAPASQDDGGLWASRMYPEGSSRFARP